MIQRGGPMDASYEGQFWLGIPTSVLNPWFATIRQLSRVWILGASEATDCTQGFPEGDNFPVVVMICVGHLWTASVQRISEHIKATAYADNWGRAAMQPRLHAPILQLTVKLVNAFMHWKKCWKWGSTKQHISLLRNALA